jgi:tetratricopeptide (TPR) repeat protein
MERDLVGKRPSFRTDKRRTSLYRIFFWLALIIAALAFLLQVNRGEVPSPFEPTATPTRMADSFLQEAEAYFQSGKIFDRDNPDAIDTYQRALEVNPNNARAWAELARIQTYSTTLLTSDREKLGRLEEALASIDRAVELNPDDSSIHAIRAFVLDWLASSRLIDQKRKEDLLNEAELESARAYQLNPENPLALTFYAEVYLDQQKWSQAEQYAARAVQMDPNSMDAHRVYATVLESIGQYRLAIEEYLKAANLNPNLTFLYLSVGQNYLGLARGDPRSPLLQKALEYYERASKINEQLGVKDPLPFLEIAKTYSQMGEFFIAARNAEKALSFDPTNPNVYGQLGIISIRSRNYEGALPILQCAVLGCTAEENEAAKNLVDQGLLEASVPVEGLEMTNTAVGYYYIQYGTVLAFLSRPTPPEKNRCQEARAILSQVRARFSDDPTMMVIVEDSEGICRNLQNSGGAQGPSEPQDGAQDGSEEATEEPVEGEEMEEENTPSP